MEPASHPIALRNKEQGSCYQHGVQAVLPSKEACTCLTTEPSLQGAWGPPTLNPTHLPVPSPRRSLHSQTGHPHF